MRFWEWICCLMAIGCTALLSVNAGKFVKRPSEKVFSSIVEQRPMKLIDPKLISGPDDFAGLPSRDTLLQFMGFLEYRSSMNPMLELKALTPKMQLYVKAFRDYGFSIVKIELDVARGGRLLYQAKVFDSGTQMQYSPMLLEGDFLSERFLNQQLVPDGNDGATILDLACQAFDWRAQNCEIIKKGV